MSCLTGSRKGVGRSGWRSSSASAQSMSFFFATALSAARRISRGATPRMSHLPWTPSRMVQASSMCQPSSCTVRM
eukprot:2168217-Pyramimonas_sp.AAC.1